MNRKELRKSTNKVAHTGKRLDQLNEQIAAKEKQAKEDSRGYTMNPSEINSDALQALMPPGSTFYWLMKPPNKSTPGVNTAGGSYWGPAPKLVPMTEAGKEEYVSIV